MANAIVNAMCKAARYLGYSKKKERRLEAYVNTIVENEGVPGLVNRFKNLQQTRIYHLEGKRESKWIAMNRHGSHPKRMVENELWSLSDRKFFSLTGAIIQACYQPITQKDIDKWRQTAGSEPLAQTNDQYGSHSLSYNSLKTYTRFLDDPYKDMRLDMLSVNNMPIGYSQPTSDPWSDLPGWIRLNMQLNGTPNEECLPELIPKVARFAKMYQVPTWDKIAQDLALRHLQSKELPFSPNDMKATAYPVGTDILHPRSHKVGRKTILDEDDVLNAYRMSQVSAPEWLEVDRRFMMGLLTIFALINEEDIYSNWSSDEIDISKNPKTAQIAYYQDEANSLLGNDPFGIRVSKHPSLSNRNISGQISFLPKPGLKARVVANPNRRVQATLTPLGEAIQNVAYNSPLFSSHVRVMDQDRGRVDVVNALKAGHKLASVDLTAATDTIDFGRALELTGYRAWQRAHTRLIKRGYDLVRNAREVKGMCELGYYPGPFGDQASMVDSPKAAFDTLKTVYSMPTNVKALSAALLDHSMKCFDAARTGDWIVKNTDGSTSTFKFLRGQPLGTRPSFPLLTLTNLMAARLSGSPFYEVVGDDIILDAEYYPKYKQIMSEYLGSPINDQKTLVSSEVAEFVGYIHTRSGHIYPKKPRITNAKVHDALSFGFKRSDIASLIDDARLSMVIGIDSLSDLPQMDDNDNLLARISANDGWNPSVTDRQIVKVAEELVQSEPSAGSSEKNLSGKAFSAHVSAVIKPDTFAYSAEERVSNVQFSTEKKVFDHHAMKHRSASESEFRRVKKQAAIGKAASELNRTGSAIVSHNNTDVLVDRTGHLDIYVDNKHVGTGKAQLVHDLHNLGTPGVALWKTVFSQFSSDSGLLHDVKRDSVDIRRVDGVSHKSDDGPSL